MILSLSVMQRRDHISQQFCRCRQWSVVYVRHWLYTWWPCASCSKQRASVVPDVCQHRMLPTSHCFFYDYRKESSRLTPRDVPCGADRIPKYRDLSRNIGTCQADRKTHDMFCFGILGAYLASCQAPLRRLHLSVHLHEREKRAALAADGPFRLTVHRHLSSCYSGLRTIIPTITPL